MLPEFDSETILNVLVFLSICALVIFIYKTYNKTTPKEGFKQMEKFILKQGSDTYDDFYAQIYDTLHLPEDRVTKELQLICEHTDANETSHFLDVGCGTGATMHILLDAGYKCNGIDKSASMITAAGDLPEMKCGDIQDAMNYERRTFTHILCLYFTIYEIENKQRFFANCAQWIRNGGSLVVHVVDKEKFNAVVPAAIPAHIDNPQKYADNHITKCGVDFCDFAYDAEYKIKPDTNTVTFVETFTDTLTKHVRQNERTMWFESKDNLVSIAQNAGFILNDDMPCFYDEHQSLLFFVKGTKVKVPTMLAPR